MSTTSIAIGSAASIEIMKQKLIGEGFESDPDNDKYFQNGNWLIVYANKKFLVSPVKPHYYEESTFINIDDERGWDLSMANHYKILKDGD